MNKKFKIFLKLFFGFLLLAFAVWKANIGKIMELKIIVPLFVLAIVLIPIPPLIKAIKWRMIIARKNRVPFFECFKIYIIGLFFGSVTPSRVGELSRAYYLTRRYGFLAGHSTASVIVDRVMELLSLSLLAVLGALFFILTYPDFLSPFTVLLLVFILVFIFLGTILISSSRFQLLLLRKLKKRQPYFDRIFFKLLNKRLDVYEVTRDTFRFLRRIRNNPPLLFKVFLISIVIWLFDFVYTYMIIRSLGGIAPLSYMFILIPLSAIISLIPVSISGIGTREVTFIYLLSFVGVSASIALASSLLMVFLNIWLPAIFGGILYIITKFRGLV